MKRNAPPDGPAGRGNGTRENVGKPESTRRAASPQARRKPAIERAVAAHLTLKEVEAKAFREGIRSVIELLSKSNGRLAAADLEKAYKDADKRLADVRRSIREAGRRRS